MESSNRAVFEPESLCAERKSKMKRDGPKQKTPLRNKWLGKQNKKKKRKAGETSGKPVNPGRKITVSLDTHNEYTHKHTHTRTCNTDTHVQM